MTTAEEKISKHLEDAHAIELALVQTLTAHISMTPEGEYRSLLERHLQETNAQSQRLRERLGELGASRSPVELVRGAVEAVVGQALAAAKAPVDLLRGGPSGEEKLLRNARDEITTEALEIATYDVIEALAEAAGDDKTRTLAREHRTQEEVMLRQLREVLPALARDAYAADVHGDGSFDAGRTGAAQAGKGAAAAAGAAARDAGGRLRGRAEEVADEATDVVEDAVDRAQGAGAAARGRAQQAAGEARERTSDAAAQARDRAQEAAGQARGRAEQAAGQARGRAEEAAGTARGRAQEAAGEARERAADAAGAVEEAAGTVEDAAGSAEDALRDGGDGEGLPVEGYERLAVGDALRAIEGLDGEELARIEAFERTNRNRKTVIDRIARRRREAAGV